MTSFNWVTENVYWYLYVYPVWLQSDPYTVARFFGFGFGFEKQKQFHHLQFQTSQLLSIALEIKPKFHGQVHKISTSPPAEVKPCFSMASWTTPIPQQILVALYIPPTQAVFVVLVLILSHTPSSPRASHICCSSLCLPILILFSNIFSSETLASSSG